MEFFKHSVMGCSSSEPTDPAGVETPQYNTKINELLKAEKKRMSRTIKVLLFDAYRQRRPK